MRPSEEESERSFREKLLSMVLGGGAEGEEDGAEERKRAEDAREAHAHLCCPMPHPSERVMEALADALQAASDGDELPCGLSPTPRMVENLKAAAAQKKPHAERVATLVFMTGPRDALACRDQRELAEYLAGMAETDKAGEKEEREEEAKAPPEGAEEEEDDLAAAEDVDHAPPEDGAGLDPDDYVFEEDPETESDSDDSGTAVPSAAAAAAATPVPEWSELGARLARLIALAWDHSVFEDDALWRAARVEASVSEAVRAALSHRRLFPEGSPAMASVRRSAYYMLRDRMTARPASVPKVMGAALDAVLGAGSDAADGVARVRAVMLATEVCGPVRRRGGPQAQRYLWALVHKRRQWFVLRAQALVAAVTEAVVSAPGGAAFHADLSALQDVCGALEFYVTRGARGSSAAAASALLKGGAVRALTAVALLKTDGGATLLAVHPGMAGVRRMLMRSALVSDEMLAYVERVAALGGALSGAAFARARPAESALWRVVTRGASAADALPPVPPAKALMAAAAAGDEAHRAEAIPAVAALRAAVDEVAEEPELWRARQDLLSPWLERVRVALPAVSGALRRAAREHADAPPSGQEKDTAAQRLETLVQLLDGARDSLKVALAASSPAGGGVGGGKKD